MCSAAETAERAALAAQVARSVKSYFLAADEFFPVRLR
jgi:hypothetical protein